MRPVGYVWALPVTLLGIAVAVIAAATGGRLRCRCGIIEAWGGFPGRFLRGGRFHQGGAAATLGHVVIARDIACLERSRQHELAHVRQFERWGVLLLPTYWLVAAWL